MTGKGFRIHASTVHTAAETISRCVTGEDIVAIFRRRVAGEAGLVQRLVARLSARKVSEPPAACRGVLSSSLTMFPALQKFAGLASLFGSHPFISLTSSGVIWGKCRMNKTRRQVCGTVCVPLKAGMPLKRTPFSIV